MNNSRRSPTLSYAGQRFGNYTLIRLLGQGGFAEVYLARHIHLKTLAAVKILRTDAANVDVDAFFDEARIAASLVHPHIVRVLEFGLEASVPFLVMDYIPNGTLRSCYPTGSRLTLKTALKYVGQTAGAVQYIHDHNYIHRDIKPENLLLNRYNELLVSDFGIALAAHSAIDDEHVGAGTITYMAPEQIDGYPCRESDQYSLGIVVYEWLHATTPFQGSVDEMIYQHFEVPPPSLCASIPIVSPAAEGVIFKALAKFPQERFESVQAFAKALQDAFEPRPIELKGNEHQSQAARSNGPVSARGEPERERSRRNRRMNRNTWKEITICFAVDMFVGAALGCIMYALGVAPPPLELLVAVCMILFSLGYAFIKENRPLCLLTCSITVASAVAALLFQSVSMFLMAVTILQLLSLLTAFEVSING
jgi:serine/threonine protein kinase